MSKFFQIGGSSVRVNTLPLNLDLTMLLQSVKDIPYFPALKACLFYNRSPINPFLGPSDNLENRVTVGCLFGCLGFRFLVLLQAL